MIKKISLFFICFISITFILRLFENHNVFAQTLTQASKSKGKIKLTELKVDLNISPPWRIIAKSSTHALFKGKLNNEVESVALILKTNLTPKLLNQEVMQSTANDYIEEKIKNLTTQDGMIISQDEFMSNYSSKNKSTLKVNSFMKSKVPVYFGTGLSYRMGLHTYSERAFFVSCPTDVLVVKLITDARAPASESIDFVRGLQCK